MSLSPLGKPTPNPGMQIINCIMGFLRAEPPLYEKIRNKICEVYGISPFFVIDQKSGLKHRIVYISPKVERLSEAEFVFMAEFHDGHPLTDEGRKTNAVAMKWAGKPEGSLTMIEFGESRLDKGEKPITGFERDFWLKRLQIPTSLTLHGWDDPNSLSSKGACYGIEAKKTTQAVLSGQMPYDPMAMMQKAMEGVKLSTAAAANVCESFDKRTKAMVDSVTFAATQKAKETIKGNILVIGGLWHFDPHPDASKPNSIMSLAPLYQSLKTLKAIVICPHKLSASALP